MIFHFLLFQVVEFGNLHVVLEIVLRVTTYVMESPNAQTAVMNHWKIVQVRLRDFLLYCSAY